MPDYLIIGAGAAGISCAQQLRKLEPEASVTVVSEEAQLCSRCMLYKGISGERSEEAMNFTDPDFFTENRIEWLSGARVERVDDRSKTVRLEDGSELGYGRLLIASGAESMFPPIPHLEEAGNVYGFRTIRDLDRIRQALKNGVKQVAVIGAGLVGLDVAQGLCDAGFPPVVVEQEAHILPLQTDAFAAEAYQRLFEEHGCRFCLGSGVESVEQDAAGNAAALLLKNGTRVPCDAVVAAVSVRPCMDFLIGTDIQGAYMNYHIQTILNRHLRKSSLHVNTGIVVNEYLQTSSPDIFAAGDVTGKAAVWPEAKAMGRCAAYNMTGRKQVCPKPEPYQNTANFWGLTMMSLGKPEADEETCEVRINYDGKNYKKLALRDGRLIGVLMLGDLKNGGVYRYVMQNGIPLERFREKELFELSFADFYGVDPENGEYRYRS